MKRSKLWLRWWMRGRRLKRFGTSLFRTCRKYIWNENRFPSRRRARCAISFLTLTKEIKSSTPLSSRSTQARSGIMNYQTSHLMLDFCAQFQNSCPSALLSSLGFLQESSAMCIGITVRKLIRNLQRLRVSSSRQWIITCRKISAQKSKGHLNQNHMQFLIWESIPTISLRW